MRLLNVNYLDSMKQRAKTRRVFSELAFIQWEYGVMTRSMQIFSAVSDRRLVAKTNG